MYQIKLGCLNLAHNYTDDFDQLFVYSDRILEYLKKDTDELRKIFYVDVGDLPAEEAIASMEKALSSRLDKQETALQAFRAEMDKPLFLLDDDQALIAATAPTLKDVDVPAQMHYSMFKVRHDDLNPDNPKALRPILQHVAHQFERTQNVIVNSCRRAGLSQLIAAIARHFMVRKMEFEGAPDQLNRVLVLTNSVSNAERLNMMIQDGSVMILTFSQAIERKVDEKGFSVVLIDNAAFIPYKQEKALRAFINGSRIQVGDEFLPQKVLMASVPGQEAGWFYEAYSSQLTTADEMKIDISWRECDMTPERAALLKDEIGSIAFQNLYCNEFRPTTF